MDKLNLDLSPEEAEKIVSFLGYGRLSAPVWFIGLEEGLGKMDDEDTAKNLKARGNFERVMDLHRAHLHLQAKGQPIDVEIEPPSTQVWQYMAKIMRARDGDKDWSEKKSYQKYIRSHLGRELGDTFLTELSPIPARRTIDKKWMTKFSKLDTELVQKIKNRKDQLRQILKETAPRLVICYGGGSKWADDFAELLDVEWRPICHKVSASHDSRCLLLPFLGQGQMSHSVIENLISHSLLDS
jgi:hypothetical protein